MVDLFAHQETAVELLSANDGFLLLMEQGTGKTFPMLIHLTNLMMAGEIDDALVVGTENLLGAWRRDIDEKLSGTRQRLAREKITFTTYGIASLKKSKKRAALERDWGAIVLDEGHAVCGNFMGATTNRTKWFVGSGGRYPTIGMNQLAKYRYILTGTLIGNGRLEDIFHAVEFIRPGYLGTKGEFKLRYLTTFKLPGSYVEIVDKKRYKRVDELMDRIAPLIFRVTKADCLDLPEKMPDEVISIPLHPETVPVYRQAEEAYIDSLDMVMDNPLVVMTKLRQVASGFVYTEDATEKFPCTKQKVLHDLIESILPHKVVVFANFKPSIAAVVATCEKLGVPFVVMDGDQKDKDIWRKFQADPQIKVFIGQYQSACEGIDLYSATHTIYFEPTNSSRILEQSRDRTHRHGVKNACQYFHFITADTIEEQMYLSLSEFQDFTETRYRDIVTSRMIESR